MGEKRERARRGDREEVREKEAVRSIRRREERARKACMREVLDGDKREREKEEEREGGGLKNFLFLHEREIEKWQNG